ncbi:transposase [Kiritimatiellaeota bacterium B1221]|nr:transposase [Kiritimatiellaeota bacterium B1221]
MKEDWEKMPSELWVRQITFTVDLPGFRPSVIKVLTKLIDPIAYPAEKIKTMYLRRWQIEVSFRDIKITRDLDILRCKTPEMIRKETWMHLIAYNALC